MSLLLSACATEEQRYKTLSFFFDGVPQPGQRRTLQQEATGTAIMTTSIVSRHKPYSEGKCNVCHRSAGGTILEFEDAYKACVGCHTKVTTEHKLMHGPVARGVCQFCHTGHESTYPVLLKDSDLIVCTQCHDAQLLGPIPSAHTDGRTSCLGCHYGHGGNERNFLKPQAVWPAPATEPATQPTTQSTTHPTTQATQPATQPHTFERLRE